MNICKIMIAVLCAVSCLYSSDDLSETFFIRPDGQSVLVLSESYAAATPAQRDSLSADIVKCVRALCAEYEIRDAFSNDPALRADEYSNFTIEETSKISVSHKIQLLGDVFAYMQTESTPIDKSRALYYAIKEELTHMVNSWEQDTSLGTQIAIENGYNSLVDMNFLPYIAYADSTGFKNFAALVVASFKEQGTYALMPEGEGVESFVLDCALHENKMEVEPAIRLFCKNVSRFAVFRSYLVILNSAMLTLERVLPRLIPLVHRLRHDYLSLFIDETKEFVQKVLDRHHELHLIKEFDILFAAIFKHAHRTTEGLCLLENLAVYEGGTSGNKDKVRDTFIGMLKFVDYNKETESYNITPEVILAARAFFVSRFNNNRDRFMRTELPRHVSATCTLTDLTAEFSAGWPEFGRKSRVKPLEKPEPFVLVSEEEPVDDRWMDEPDMPPVAGGGSAGAGGPGKSKAPRSKRGCAGKK